MKKRSDSNSMTSPRRKEWLFDEKTFDEEIFPIGQAEGWGKSAERIKNYIQTEIKRNIGLVCEEINAKGEYDFGNGSKIVFKECTWVREEIKRNVRDFAEELKEKYFVQSFHAPIDAALKEYGIDPKVIP